MILCPNGVNFDCLSTMVFRNFENFQNDFRKFKSFVFDDQQKKSPLESSGEPEYTIKHTITPTTAELIYIMIRQWKFTPKEHKIAFQTSIFVLE